MISEKFQYRIALDVPTVKKFEYLYGATEEFNSKGISICSDNTVEDTGSIDWIIEISRENLREAMGALITILSIGQIPFVIRHLNPEPPNA